MTWLLVHHYDNLADDLLAARRPKPLGSAEQALEERSSSSLTELRSSPADGEMAELVERPAPVAVSERPWEREGWCDTDGLCWLGSQALDGCTPTWLFGPPAWAERFPTVHRVVLPAHALPLPEVGE